MKQFLLLSMFTLLLLAGACKKEDPVVKTVHKDTVITGNQFPPYNGVTTIQVQNYVNKLYIDLLGREPSDAEMTAGVNMLKQGSLADASRLTLIRDLLARDEYFKRLFIVTSDQMLEGTDSATIARSIMLLQYQVQLLVLDGNLLLAAAYQEEVKKLQDLQNGYLQLQNSLIQFPEFYHRFIMNTFYDDINMGTENFVVSVFENFYKRQPTTAELASAGKMVDGVASSIFLQSGNTKYDFAEIAVSNEEFFQGRVVDAYQLFLLRKPNSGEMSAGTSLLITSKSLQRMQEEILKSKEYAGF